MYIVKEVLTKKAAKLFTRFPNRLFKDVEAFSPALTHDELAVFNPKTNPVFEYCDAIRFLAFDQKGQVVGRIAGIINHKINQAKNEVEVRFARFDCINDQGVANVLFEAIIGWAKEQNATRIIGPMGFTDLDRMGMLVDGFEELNMFITIWNPPYYQQLVENLGFEKDVDWIEKQLEWPSEVPERVSRASLLIKKRYGFKLVKIEKKSDITKYGMEAFKVYNDAFLPLYGFYPLTEKVQAYYIKQVIQLAQLDFMWLVKNASDQIIGFGMMMPSLALANKKNQGELFPFGLFRLMKALKKFDTVDLYFVAIDPKYQNLGVFALILEDAIKEGIKHQVKWAETGPELEVNQKIINQWATFKHRTHKRRRSFKKEI